ncbi:hypothetical protein CIK84_07395 [Glutamicibacter arilaitensis]|uniref:Terminase n=2 Tax=Glutamicibacter arilaitensis TaxID=256701 RepID=A0A2N7S5I6_9MICC|nr:hypothetical protein CIK84_07395 [Glutamicibacter arilaitensis]
MLEEDFLEALGAAQPLYATKPTPGAENELKALEMTAKLQGRPLMPWQRLVGRVATEKDSFGNYKYKIVVITVPRQSGKTTIVMSLDTMRGIKYPGSKAFYTAQSGKDARERLFDLADNLQASPIGNEVIVHRAAGAPRITLPTGSRIHSFSPTPESLHGYTPRTVTLDEIFAFDSAEGNLLLGAVTPAQQTVRDRQLIMTSTAGTSDSTFLADWVERGRQATQETDTQIAYFEWSLADGLDPFDPSNWDFHPGLQGGLIEKADIAAAAESMSRGEFIRAFMNRPTIQKSDAVFDLKAWAELKTELSEPLRREVAIGFEVNADRSRAAIVAAWKNGNSGEIHHKVIRNGSGINWLAPTLEQLAEYRPTAIGADRYAQNNALVSELSDELQKEVVTLTPEHIKTACVAYKGRIEDGTVKHTGDGALTRAVSEAMSRPMGEGWVLSHNSPPEVVAAVVAVRLLALSKEESQPLIAF